MSNDEPRGEAYIAALLQEREGYARRGRANRVADVDAELVRLGVTREDAHEGVETAVAQTTETAAPASVSRRAARTRKA